MGDPPLELKFDDEPARFLSLVRPVLLAREVEHTLLWAILGHLVRRAAVAPSGAPTTATDPRPSPAPLLLRAERGGEVAGVAVQTPPRQLVLGEFEPGDAADVARALAARRDRRAGQTLPGVLGPNEAAAAFAQAWVEAGGAGSARPGMRQRLYQASDVLEVLGTRGRMRMARPADGPLIAAWLDAFEAEALPDETRRSERPARTSDDIAAWLDADETSGLALWETPEGPAAMAGYTGPTPSGIRISAVFTPPDKRRRGFATALVSWLSRRLLARFERVMLFTNLDNPTSNGIYRRIGYEPVRDVDAWVFEGGDALDDPRPGG